MPKILKIQESKHISGRMLVFFQDAELIKLTENEVLGLGLYAGQELSSGDYHQLTQRAKLSSAKSAAARICARKMLSRQELLQKLREKGEDPAYLEQTADWLEELGVLDDGKYAAAVVRHYSARGYGRKKLENEFFRRRIPREYWSEALEELPEADDTIDRLIRQRLRNKEPDPKELGRVQNFLLRRGYSWEQVREGLERFTQCGE
jgi:regulatory protein